MSRIPYLDFLKGFLILLVVIGHTLQHGIYRGEGFWNDSFLKWIYIFHMPLFMAVAGFLSQSGIDRVTPPQAIRTRFMTYMVPLIAWCVLYCVLVRVLARDFSLESLRTMPGYVFIQIIGDLWFLWALFLSVAATAVCRYAGKWFTIVYPLSWLPILFLPEFQNVPLFKYTYPFFQIGYALARWGVPSVLVRRRLPLFLISTALAIVFYIAWREETFVYISGMWPSPDNLPRMALRYAGAITMSAAVLYALWFIHGKLPEKMKAPLYAFGRDSIYIYILQNYFFMIVARAGDRIAFPKPDLVTGWLIALLLGAVVSAACYFAGTLMCRSYLAGSIFFGKGKIRKTTPV
jgi:fucose 4-O-acetylase-like acetyltransferase